jgi:hypothetical protein
MQPESVEGAVFIRISNKDIYDKIVELEKKVDVLNIKVYGIIGGFIAAAAYLVSAGSISV